MFSSLSKVRPNTREFQCAITSDKFGNIWSEPEKNWKKLGKTEKFAEKCAFLQKLQNIVIVYGIPHKTIR